MDLAGGIFGIVGTLSGAGLTGLATHRREAAADQRRTEGAAWLVHEDLWTAQNTVARALHSLGEAGGTTRCRAYRGRWWFASEHQAPRAAAEDLAYVARGLTRARVPETDPSGVSRGLLQGANRWRWISKSLTRMAQLDSEAARARRSAAETRTGSRPSDDAVDHTRVELRWRQPRRLVESYYRLEIARHALDVLIGDVAPRDAAAWTVPADAPLVTQQWLNDRRPSVPRFDGEAADLNHAARLAVVRPAVGVGPGRLVPRPMAELSLYDPGLLYLGTPADPSVAGAIPWDDPDTESHDPS